MKWKIIIYYVSHSPLQRLRRQGGGGGRQRLILVCRFETRACPRCQSPTFIAALPSINVELVFTFNGVTIRVVATGGVSVEVCKLKAQYDLFFILFNMNIFYLSIYCSSNCGCDYQYYCIYQYCLKYTCYWINIVLKNLHYSPRSSQKYQKNNLNIQISL